MTAVVFVETVENNISESNVAQYCVVFNVNILRRTILHDFLKLRVKLAVAYLPAGRRMSDGKLRNETSVCHSGAQDAVESW
jgi:hypothetical protein